MIGNEGDAQYLHFGTSIAGTIICMIALFLECVKEEGEVCLVAKDVIADTEQTFRRRKGDADRMA